MTALKMVTTLGSAAGLALLAAGCSRNEPAAPPPPAVKATPPVSAAAFKPARVAFRLDQLAPEYRAPDGMTIGKDGCIYLSMNNHGSPHVARIMRITPDDRLEEVIQLPPHPDTGVASPLGIGFGSDGHLYVSDNQDLAGKGLGKSRLLRVVMQDGKAERVEVVATGFNAANGLACRGDEIFVAETTLKTVDGVLHSGVYRLKLAELKADAPLVVAGEGDPRLIVKLTTTGAKYVVGANGVALDSKGNLYVCNFGECAVVKVTFDAEGHVLDQSVLARGQGMESVDGMQADAEDNLWIADFIGNAVVKVEPATGKVTIVAKNGVSDGADGSLDSPSECIRRGNKVYVSNIDLTFGPHAKDDVQTISVIEL